MNTTTRKKSVDVNEEIRAKMSEIRVAEEHLKTEVKDLKEALKRQDFLIVKYCAIRSEKLTAEINQLKSEIASLTVRRAKLRTA